MDALQLNSDNILVLGHTESFSSNPGNHSAVWLFTVDSEGNMNSEPELPVDGDDNGNNTDASDNNLLWIILIVGVIIVVILLVIVIRHRRGKGSE